MYHKITPLIIAPIEQLSAEDKNKIGILDFVSNRNKFFDPWGEEEFWREFCIAFPHLAEVVHMRKNLFSVGYLQSGSDNVGRIVKKIIPSEKNKLFVGLCLNEDYDKLPFDIKLKIAFHEVLHFMRLSGCKIESDDSPILFYTKEGHIVEKYDSSGERIDGFGQGLEEASVESMALSAVQIHNINHEYVSTKHPYSSLVYGFNKLKHLGFQPLFEEIANTPIEECVNFYNRIFDCLYNEPTNEFDANYDNLCEAFDTLYFQTLYGFLRGVLLEEMISKRNDFFNNFELAINNFTINVGKNAVWLDGEVVEKSSQSKR